MKNPAARNATLIFNSKFAKEIGMKKMKVQAILEIDELGNYIVIDAKGFIRQFIGETEVKAATVTFQDSIEVERNFPQTGLQFITLRVNRKAAVTAAADGRMDVEFTTSHYGDRMHGWATLSTRTI